MAEVDMGFAKVLRGMDVISHRMGSILMYTVSA